MSVNAKIKMFSCKMKDGSIFTMPNETWQKAYEMKYSDSDQEEIKRIFIETTAKHWKAKTIPTNYDFDERWKNKNEYKNHADLGENVMYKYIRAAVMGIIFSELSKGKGKVMAIQDDGTVAKYGGKKAKLYKDLDAAFGKKKKAKK